MKFVSIIFATFLLLGGVSAGVRLFANNNNAKADLYDAFLEASKNGHLEVVQHLLTLPGVDPTAYNNLAIRWAAVNGHLEVVKELLTLADVDPSAQNNEALRRASKLVKVDSSALESQIYEFSMAAKMAKQLSSIGLVEKDIIGDGNCLFSSLSDQLFGDPSSQRRTRAEICDYIEVNEADFKLFLDENDEGFEKYLQNMKNDKTFGTNLELVAASRLYNRAIYVHQLGQPPWKIGEDAITSSGDNSPLHILYHNYQHYSSLRNMDGPYTGLPNIKIKMNGINGIMIRR